MPAQLPTDKKLRKKFPVTTGVLDYFPDALAAVAYVSYVGNAQHNGPGTPLRWTRHLSDDHEDCIGRHMVEKGTLDIDGTRHSAKRAWRALAALQLEIEAARARGEPGLCVEDVSPAAAGGFAPQIGLVPPIPPQQFTREQVRLLESNANCGISGEH
jgi:hypothetical protein